jgi:hypothetical protein
MEARRYTTPHYAKNKDGSLVLDKATTTPVWCGSAASRLEHHKNLAASELIKELEQVKAKLAHYEKKYGRFETKEWQEAVARDNALYEDRVGMKGTQ